MKKYEVDKQVIFEEEEDAIQYCAENEIDTSKILVIEEKEEEVIDAKDLEEKPDEDSVIMDDARHKKLQALQDMVEHWDEISDTDKRIIMSEAFGTETGKEKSFGKKHKLVEGKVDGILKKDIGKVLGDYHLEKLTEKIENGICPICDLHHSQDAFYKGVELPEELDFFKPSTRALKENPPKFTKATKNRSPKMLTPEKRIRITIHHIKSRHKSLYKLLYDVFNQFQWKKDIPDWKLQPMDSPESLSKEYLEKLDKEELTQEICENPELRSQLFKLWKKKLEDRK